MGYPFILALSHVIFGTEPMLAVWLNIAISAATIFVIINLALRMNLSAATAICLAASLILFDAYLDEVFSGRSIPLAMLVFLVSCSLFLSKKYLLSGLLLGFSALVRFDYLVYAILFQTGVIVLAKRGERHKHWLLLCGFAAGIAPWVIYSLTHFGRLWVSDNSWVVLSATPAFVLDFPAAPLISISDSPLTWINRIFGNAVSLSKSIAWSSLKYPTSIIFSIYFLLRILKTPKSHLYRNLFIAILLIISISPYVLTGYFDSRYFSLLFFAVCFLSTYEIEALQQKGNTPYIHNGIVIASIIFSTVIGGLEINKLISEGNRAIDMKKIKEQAIVNLARCHSDHPQATFVFGGEAMEIAPQYGAITGLPAAFIPSNYYRMTHEEQLQYLDHMKPYVLIETLEGLDKCQLMGRVQP